MPLVKGIPDYALYAGGGLVLGGGYLLYRKRKASSAPSPSGAVSAPSLDTTSSYGQQPSIVPYYLTGNSGNDFRGTQGGGVTTQGPPLPTPTGPPSSDVGGSLPSIPPILPPTPTAPTPPPAPAPTPTAPTPSPPPAQNNNIPADLLARITANGERIVSSLAAPGGGVWYLGSKGGVFAINAPYYGGPAGQSYWGSRTGLQIVPNGQGYTVVDTAGERYSYGP